MFSFVQCKYVPQGFIHPNKNKKHKRTTKPFDRMQTNHLPTAHHSSFSQIDKIDNKDNIDIRGFTT